MNLLVILGYPLLVVAVLETVLGVLLIRLHARHSPVNKAVAVFSFVSAAFALSTALMYLSASAGRDHLLFARLSWIGWLSIPAALQVIFYLRDGRSRVARAVGWLLYPFWSVILLLTVTTDFVVTDHYILWPFENSPGPLENPLRMLGGSLIVWLMVEIIRLRKEVTGLKRAQLNYFFHGTFIFAAMGSVTAVFLQLFGGFGIEPGLASYFSFPWVVLTFYAISRYRLFDIRLVLSTVVSAVLVFSVFAGLHVALFRILEPFFGSSFAVFASLSLIVLIFIGAPVGRHLQNLVQRTILQDKYVYQDVMKESIKAIVTILDFGELLDYIIDTTKQNLQADSVALFLNDSAGSYVLRHGIIAFAHSSQGVSLAPEIVELVLQAGQAVVREELERILPEEEFSGANRSLKEIDAELIIPIRYKGKLNGVLTVGRKGTGEHYVQSDIDLLEALAGHAAVAIENARLYEAASQAQESLQQSEARLSVMAEHAVSRYLSR